MYRKLLLFVLLLAPFACADSFTGSCSASDSTGGFCGGDYVTPAGDFGFAVPWDNSLNNYGGINVGIGTNGGEFSYQGNTCTYAVLLGGQNCYGQVWITTSVGIPPINAYPVGDVVSTTGTGTVQGWFCWGDEACTPPIEPFFTINVIATYQFTVLDPTGDVPFSVTGAEFSLVPEPEMWSLMAFGLTALGGGLFASGKRNFGMTVADTCRKT